MSGASPEAGPIQPDKIDASFVATTRGGLDSIELEDETVIYDIDGDRAHHLDQLGTVIWACLDGTGTLDELAADVAEAFATPPAVVAADLLEFVRELGRQGLLEGVEVPPEGDPRALALSVGQPIDPFVLEDISGATVHLSDYRGRQVLLVGWNPRSSACDGIARALAGLDPALREAGTDLVLVSIGTAKENRAKAFEQGLRCPILLQDEASLPAFSGLGMPAAYLLDVEARVAEAPALGPNRVLALARQTAGVVED